MHLYYPHHASQPQSATTSFQKLLSPPRTHFDTHNRDFFSIFYTAAVVLPHVITLVFWAVLIPEKHADYPVSELFTHGWYRGFWVLNKYAINSLLALVEVVALSSIRRQTPVWAHIFALVVLANLYVGWVYIGHKILHRYAYFFFDHAMIGWEFVSAAIIGASFLPIVFFAFVYGITGLREVITKKRESTSYGYSRLPQ
ncbi:hypothetical protein PVAG01_07382 [Phlyctema vagabunda]|uniref:Uncharacterized protein n=1 Tax=Phlyctema vagabunda TaxID=108571 RepID=A0ABR4PCP8_9HELO